MRCPQCGEEMQPGFLQAGNLLAFNRNRHKISLNPRDEGDVVIARKAFGSADFPGFICRGCGLVVFNCRDVLTRL